MIQSLSKDSKDFLAQQRSSNPGLNPNPIPHVHVPTRCFDPGSSLTPAAAAHSGAILPHSRAITPVTPVPKMDKDLIQARTTLLQAFLDYVDTDSQSTSSGQTQSTGHSTY